VQDIVPVLFSFVRDSGISVAAALDHRRWVRDIRGGLSSQAFAQYLRLWDLVEPIVLNSGYDEAIWQCTTNGRFSVSSAYQLYFIANSRFACAKAIWKSKAPMNCKFFMWLVVHKRCLTADNLQRRGWPHTSCCVLCQTSNEDCTHLFVHCRFSHQVWISFREWTNANFPVPSNTFRSTEDWWTQVRKMVPKEPRHDFDTVAILVHWRIWKERNARIFRQECNPPSRVLELIIEDLRTWRAAGCVAAF
jgi:hypothetical protein